MTVDPAVELAYRRALDRELEAHSPERGSTLGHPTLRKGIVTSVSPFLVDSLPASNISGHYLASGRVVWMAVDAGRRLVLGPAATDDLGPLGYAIQERGGADRSVPSGLQERIAYNQWTSVDGAGDFDVSSDTIVALRPIVVAVTAGVIWDGNTAGARALRITKNSDRIADLLQDADTHGGFYPRMTTSRAIELDTDDNIEVYVWQNSGGTRTVVADPSTFRTVHVIRRL